MYSFSIISRKQVPVFKMNSNFYHCNLLPILHLAVKFYYFLAKILRPPKYRALGYSLVSLMVNPCLLYTSAFCSYTHYSKVHYKSYALAATLQQPAVWTQI